mgnify:CR=1 FL=1
MSLKGSKTPIIFVLTIDTEEEWDWSGPFPQKVAKVNNIDKLPAFNSICEKLGIRPTYFVDYAVSNSKNAVEKMQTFTSKGNCEIGAHLHPWCNPPYFGEVGEAESHVINLPVEQDPLKQGKQQTIYELPVTVGFNRTNFELANSVHVAFAKPPLSWTRFNGLAWHSNLLRKIYLCPELSAPEDMLTLCEKVIDKGYPVLHMYMHSSSLLDNQVGLLDSEQNPFDFISDAVTKVVTQLKSKYDIEFCTISEAADKLQTMDKPAA